MKQSEITDDVERLLFEVIRPLYARDTDAPELLELPLAQLRALNVLGNDGEERTPTMGELADALGVALSTATQLAERIEKRGLARREHSDPDDRRVVRLGLTDDGRRLLAERRRRRHERLADALARMTPGQTQALVAALTPLAAAVRHVDRDGVPADTTLSRPFQTVH